MHWDSERNQITNQYVEKTTHNIRHNRIQLQPLFHRMRDHDLQLPIIDNVIEEIRALYRCAKVAVSYDTLYQEAWAARRLLSLAKNTLLHRKHLSEEITFQKKLFGWWMMKYSKLTIPMHIQKFQQTNVPYKIKSFIEKIYNNSRAQYTCFVSLLGRWCFERSWKGLGDRFCHSKDELGFFGAIIPYHGWSWRLWCSLKAGGYTNDINDGTTQCWSPASHWAPCQWFSAHSAESDDLHSPNDLGRIGCLHFQTIPEPAKDPTNPGQGNASATYHWILPNPLPI